MARPCHDFSARSLSSPSRHHISIEQEGEKWRDNLCYAILILHAKCRSLIVGVVAAQEHSGPSVTHWPTSPPAAGFMMVSRPDGICPVQVCCMREIELSPSPQVRTDEDFQASKMDG